GQSGLRESTKLNAYHPSRKKGRRVAPDERAPPSVIRLEAQLEAHANIPGRAVEVLNAVDIPVVIGVQRRGLLSQRVALVAVAEPRLGPDPPSAIHQSGPGVQP